MLYQYTFSFKSHPTITQMTKEKSFRKKASKEKEADGKRLDKLIEKFRTENKALQKLLKALKNDEKIDD
jgi:hypothetical protein